MTTKKPPMLKIRSDASQQGKDAYAEVLARMSMLKQGNVLAIREESLRQMASAVYISSRATTMTRLIEFIKNKHRVYVIRHKSSDVFAMTPIMNTVQEANIVSAIDSLTLMEDGEFKEESLPLDMIAGIFDMNKARAAIDAAEKKKREYEIEEQRSMTMKYKSNPVFGAF